MGFLREKYSNNQGGLVVSFQGNINSANYFAGNNVDNALEYFNMYLQDGVIYIKTDEELALETIGIKTEDEATELRSVINTITTNYTDEQAFSQKILFPNWAENINYDIGARVRYGNRLYKVLQAHISQADWTPTQATSLFARILIDEENNEPLNWEQPTSTNPYMLGDRVIFNGQIYESTIDFNVWSPETHPNSWLLIEPIVPEEPQDEIPEWTQPDSTNAYQTGDRVRFNGSIYESVINNNIWSPNDYPAGWTLIE